METTECFQINGAEKEATLASSIGIGAKHPNIIRTSKYNVFNFLPLNLIHQLSKYSTLFFFVTLILLCIPAISPFPPWPYAIAFLIVIGVSIIKDGFEDYQRHCSDKKINMRECTTLSKTGEQIKKRVMDVDRGDFILISDQEDIPADVVVLGCERNSGCSQHCYIDTSNLDGESNLKKRQTPVPRTGVCGPSARLFCACLGPVLENARSFELKDTGDTFNEFYCLLNFNDNSVLANERNVMLRGAVLKNTQNALCLVVAVGPDTKQCKSCIGERKGKSLFEREMDHILFVIALLYAIMLISTTAMGAYMSYSNGNILFINSYSKFKKVAKLLFSNYILYSYLIPLSLYVMIEVSRFFQALYIKYDRNMKSNGIKSVCRNSNVLEDLGIIDYILTDKTGTITKNSLTLKMFHIRGDSRPREISEVLGGHPSSPSVERFLTNILVCNSVEVLNGEYEGISQDELCFLKGIKEYGYELRHKGASSVTFVMNGQIRNAEIIKVIDFTSKRQSMSVIVKCDQKVFVFTKGADQRILDGGKNENLVWMLNRASDYRVLVMVCKELSDAEADEIKEYSGTEARIDGAKMEALMKIVDRHIAGSEYLGATFIEDRLQDGVVETTERLKAAGIRIWIVTGDKMETTLSCAKNASIVEAGGLYKVTDGKGAVRELEELVNGRQPGAEGGVYGAHGDPFLVRSAGDLYAGISADSNTSSQEEGMNIFDYGSVIIYRATPSQKGKIASLMAKARKNTLAIGDGNNDVAMLKDSHVGVGIIGKEGAQAALAGDFAIPEFRILQNLILIHGRYNLIRYSKVAVNAYYKNVVFILIQYFYNFYNGASGRPVYNNFFMNYYNLFFTSLVPFSIALFDRDAPPAQVLETPATYRHARSHFCRKIIWLNLAYAILEGIIIYFSIYLFVRLDVASIGGKLGGYSCISTLFSIVVFFAMILRQYRIVSYVVSFTYISLALSIIFHLIVLLGFEEISSSSTAAAYNLFLMPVVYVILFAMFGTVYSLDTLFDFIHHRLMVETRK